MKQEEVEGQGQNMSGENYCTGLEQSLWFDLGKTMQKIYSMHDNHIKYIKNYIPKPFKIMVIPYTECMCKIVELSLYLSPPSKNPEEWFEDDRLSEEQSCNGKNNMEGCKI